MLDSTIQPLALDIQVSVREKCHRFCKCLRFLKSGFAIFSDFSGHQSLQALAASNRKSMTEIPLSVSYVFPVDKK